MLNRFTSLSPTCLRSQYLSFWIIAALCFNYLPLPVQAIIPLSDPGARHPQVERRVSLSGSGYSVAPDLAQSQASQNPPGQAGQQDQPIRVKTELIELRAVVTDKRGQAVTDLKKEDFELMENGKPREVSFFSVVKIPGRGEVRQAVNTPANVATDAPAGRARPAEPIGRTVLLYVDTLHLSLQSLLSVKQSLRKFIGERLTDQDLTAIVPAPGLSAWSSNSRATAACCATPSTVSVLGPTRATRSLRRTSPAWLIAATPMGYKWPRRSTSPKRTPPLSIRPSCKWFRRGPNRFLAKPLTCAAPPYPH